MSPASMAMGRHLRLRPGPAVHLAESEQQERTRRSLERRLLRSRLGRFTPMSNFDWAWPKRIDRPTVEATLRLDFLAGARNVVLVAPQGLGKTMIAQNIAHAAVLAGHHVLFKTAAELLLDLGAQESARGLGRRLNYYATRGLFVIDEIGYLSYDARAADLLFQAASPRHERRTLAFRRRRGFGGAGRGGRGPRGGRVGFGTGEAVFRRSQPFIADGSSLVG